jgi:hypothetical protein
MAAVGLVLAACGTGTTPTSSSGQKVKVRPRMPSCSHPPNYIFPLAALAHFSVSNIFPFSELLYRPLCWFGQHGTLTLTRSLLLTDPPVYSNGGQTVTIGLKNHECSDGTHCHRPRRRVLDERAPGSGEGQPDHLGWVFARRLSRQCGPRLVPELQDHRLST